MGLNMLAVAALAGSAMAACPLSVAIVDTVDHVATVAVTNTGSEAVTVFKGNTVLSDHNTRDVFATADGKSCHTLSIEYHCWDKINLATTNSLYADGTDLEFMGSIVNYKKTGLSPEHFQTIAAGETVNSTVDVSQTYALSGVESSEITVLQGFKYITGSTAPTTTNGLESCDDVSSNTVSITPDQAKVAA